MTDPRFIRPWSLDEGLARARDGFRANFDAQPAGVWAAPGRVNLIGEHTDYNGGLALPIALPHRTYFAAARAPEDTARLTSAQAPDEVFATPMSAVAPGAISGWGTYAVGVIWALRRRGFPASALTGHVDSCLPFGAGLSSSAALEAAVALAAVDLGSLSDAVPPLPAPSPVSAPGAGSQAPGRPSRQVLVEACVEAENRIAGAPTGGMDQAAALLSRPGHALLVDSADGSARPLPFDLAAAGLELLVIDTRAKHALVDGQYGQRRATCAEAAALLGLDNLGRLPIEQLPEAIDRLGGPATVAGRRVRHVVTEIDRVRRFAAALQAGRLVETGPLMDASHASLRDDYQVSSPELDAAVAAARQAGAIGARMTGGGFGGSAIALLHRGRATLVADAVARAFAAAGWKPPVFLAAEAAGAGDRLAGPD
ncbi:MAG: galactokinase [Bifidobacteriaceae bacterium]|jgi:galactokinase|nr:galactokinase [Bifidobacteriaceae bacterium]